MVWVLFIKRDCAYLFKRRALHFGLVFLRKYYIKFENGGSTSSIDRTNERFWLNLVRKIGIAKKANQFEFLVLIGERPGVEFVKRTLDPVTRSSLVTTLYRETAHYTFSNLENDTNRAIEGWQLHPKASSYY